MIRACKVAHAAGGPLWRTVLGLAMLAVVLAVFLPPPETDARARPEPGGPAANANTVTLTVPEGERAGTLNVVDASGRELAMLTYFSDGELVLVACRSGETSMSVWFTGKGTARVRMSGTSQATTIEMEPDGTTRSEKTGA
jgi:hypothetical protein